MKPDFPSLSPRAALRYAIIVEARNTQIYNRLGEMCSRWCPDSPQIVSAFSDLAEREKGLERTECGANDFVPAERLR